MIALHAWRSADAIRAFRRQYPDRPLIVALAGTDINDFIERDPQPTLRSLDLADRLVGLQDLARRRLPRRYHRKFSAILQSALPVARRVAGRGRAFEVAVIAQLRAVKDPLRAAKAARLLLEHVADSDHSPRDCREQAMGG